MENKKYRNYEIILYPENQEHIDVLYKVKKDFKYAYILHNKDRKDDGELKKEHWHVLLFLDNQKTLSAFSKQIGLQDNMQLIQIIKDKKKAIRYLVHVDNDEKESYDVEDIITNIDIANYFSNLQSDESVDIDNMFLFIDEYKGYLSYRTFFRFVRDSNIWSNYRRNQFAINKLIDEHNADLREEALPIFYR